MIFIKTLLKITNVVYNTKEKCRILMEEYIMWIVQTSNNKIMNILLYILIAVFIIMLSVMCALKASANANERKIQEQKYAIIKEKCLNKVKHEINTEIFEVQKLTEKGKENIKNIYKSDKKVAYLTFDDGPSKTVTPLILDVLKAENVRATFFVLGSRVEMYPEILQRVYNEGHYIANHGYSHIYSGIYATPQNVLDEYNKTEECIKKALNNDQYDSQLFRFPGGSSGGVYKDVKAQAIQLLEQNNVAHVNWSALTNDSVGHPTKESMMEQLKATVGNKKVALILMHDAGDKILTYEILPQVIQYLREQGYEFGHIGDLIM